VFIARLFSPQRPPQLAGGGEQVDGEGERGKFKFPSLASSWSRQLAILAKSASQTSERIFLYSNECAFSIIFRYIDGARKRANCAGQVSARRPLDWSRRASRPASQPVSQPASGSPRAYASQSRRQKNSLLQLASVGQLGRRNLRPIRRAKRRRLRWEKLKVERQVGRLAGWLVRAQTAGQPPRAAAAAASCAGRAANVQIFPPAAAGSARLGRSEAR